jgi:argininosuccinate synthase
VNAVEGRPRPKYSELVYNGFWFSPEREALQALVTETQRDVTGVRLKLYKGDIIVAGRKSPKSLYDSKIATMEMPLRSTIRATPPDSFV